MLSLILAGETIFLPAFHLGRYFKSSLLTTYGIDEFQLGRLGALRWFSARRPTATTEENTDLA